VAKRHGASIGASVITTVTATCIFFEIIGPILTKIGLTKAGEIKPSQLEKHKAVTPKKSSK
jgi:hypothetical protein